jgi:hypothetical protein
VNEGPSAIHPDRRTRAAATVALAALLGACTQERMASRERLSFSSAPLGGGRMVVEGQTPAAPRGPRAEVDPVARVPWGRSVLPLVRPDGLRAAIEVSGAAPWSVRLGDPLPPGGLDAQIEAVSLDPSLPGAPVTRLSGAWILGRGSDARGFLVERPHLDGRRDVALAGWEGGVETLIADGWCNAHATIDPGGALAWCRRAPEAGEWRLVVRRGGRESELDADPGTDWLVPVFSGDGRGLFAIELRGTAAALTWIPFGADGLPDAQACRNPGRLRSPVSAGASLAWAARAMEPVTGTAASPEGSGRLMAWLPDAGALTLWQPGSEPIRLTEGSLAGAEIDEGNVVVTLAESLRREVLGAPPPYGVLADEPWVPRPVVGRPGVLVGMLARESQVQFAVLRLGPTPTPR